MEMMVLLRKLAKIQEDYLQNLTLDNGYVKNIKLIDKTNIHNNHLQIINQYEENEGERKTRYDVTILVNGLPLVHIELKKRGNAIREAFNQINRYQRDSFLGRQRIVSVCTAVCNLQRYAYKVLL